MKKTLLLNLLILVMVSFGMAQSLSLSHTNGTAIEDGSTIEVLEEPGNDIIEAYVHVTNNSTNALNVKVKKVEIELMANTMNTFCWGESCFPPTTFVSPTPITIGSGETEESFHGEYHPQGVQGTSTMMYVFFDADNTNDSVSLYVEYTAGYVGLDEEAQAQKTEINAYPNPATDYTHVEYTLPSDYNGKAKVMLINVLGAVVKEIPVSESQSKLRIDVNDLKEGVYFYTLVLDNEQLLTRKLIVN